MLQISLDNNTFNTKSFCVIIDRFIFATRLSQSIKCIKQTLLTLCLEDIEKAILCKRYEDFASFIFKLIVKIG